ncbi:hypothetical protein VIDI103191_04185 [Vibrio diazotrophicus]
MGHKQVNTNTANLGVAEVSEVGNRCIAFRLLSEGLSNIKNKKSEH